MDTPYIIGPIKGELRDLTGLTDPAPNIDLVKVYIEAHLEWTEAHAILLQMADDLCAAGLARSPSTFKMKVGPTSIRMADKEGRPWPQSWASPAEIDMAQSRFCLACYRLRESWLAMPENLRVCLREPPFTILEGDADAGRA